MNLVKSSDPILTTPCQPFNFQDTPFDPYDFSREIVKFMYENNGIGLAANQVGVPYRVFSMRADPENFVCFNPRVVQPSEMQVVLEEGCLTFPGLIVKVKRPQHIRVRFQTPNGDTLTKQFTGMSARVFQHELDHLDGVLYFNRANRYHKETAMKKWKRGDFSTINVNPLGEYREHLLRR
jgi:peptide deformylase